MTDSHFSPDIEADLAEGVDPSPPVAFDAEPSLFGFSLNRLVAFLGPYLAVASGAVADWLLVHVHLLANFHVGKSQLASAIVQAFVFGITTLVVWLGHQKWLDGFQKWAYQQAGTQPLAHTPVTLISPIDPSTDALMAGTHPEGDSYDSRHFDAELGSAPPAGGGTLSAVPPPDSPDRQQRGMPPGMAPPPGE